MLDSERGTPEARIRDDIAQQTREDMIDFNTISPGERQNISRFFYLWAFTRGFAKWPVTFAREYPGRTAAAAMLADPERRDDFGVLISALPASGVLKTKKGPGKIRDLGFLDPTGGLRQQVETGIQVAHGNFQGVGGMTTPPLETALQAITGGPRAPKGGLGGLVEQLARDTVPFWDIGRKATTPGVTVSERVKRVLDFHDRFGVKEEIGKGKNAEKKRKEDEQIRARVTDPAGQRIVMHSQDAYWHHKYLEQQIRFGAQARRKGTKLTDEEKLTILYATAADYFPEAELPPLTEALAAPSSLQEDFRTSLRETMFGPRNEVTEVSLPPGWQADIIKGLGGQHSAGAEHLLGAWQQWEGGGTHNDATYNPLNTTIGKGYRKINSVGVSAFPDWQTGIAETVRTLGGYPALSEALRTGEIDFSNPALQADFNKWLTGRQTPGMTPYVAKIARSFGQDVPLSETRAATNSVPPPPPVRPKAAAPSSNGRITFMDIALGKKSIMDMFFQRKPAPAASTPAPPGVPAAPQAGAGQPGWTPMPVTSTWKNMDASKYVGTPEKRSGPSAPHGQEILNFVGQVGAVARTKLTPWGNESHSLTTVNGNRSAHADGNAADIPASGAELIRLGRAALVAAGMSPKEAAKADGGLYNIGGKQVIFNTDIGGNHHDHVHVGLRH